MDAANDANHAGRDDHDQLRAGIAAYLAAAQKPPRNVIGRCWELGRLGLVVWWKIPPTEEAR